MTNRKKKKHENIRKTRVFKENDLAQARTALTKVVGSATYIL